MQQIQQQSEASKEEQLRRQEESEKHRFTIELEFIQCLANPHYKRSLNFGARASQLSRARVASAFL